MMEGLAKLVVIVFLSIQLTAIGSIVATLYNLKWLACGMMLVSSIAGIYTGRARYEGMVFWFLPCVAAVFWCWKFYWR